MMNIEACPRPAEVLRLASREKGLANFVNALHPMFCRGICFNVEDCIINNAIWKKNARSSAVCDFCVGKGRVDVVHQSDLM